MIRLSFSKFHNTSSQRAKLTVLALASAFLSIGTNAQAQIDDVGISTPTGSISISDLTGTVPSKDICTQNRETDDNTKIFFLYNIGTGLFLSPGGSWGTHTSLSDVGFKMWMEANDKGTYDSFNIRTTLTTQEDWGHADKDIYRYIRKRDNGIFMDNKKGEGEAWKFEPVTDNGYTADSHVYRIKSETSNYYMTATPDDANANYVQGQTAISSNKAYQYWKLISIHEYYRLFSQTPAELKKPTDATFLLKDPNFHVNNTYISYWKTDNNDTFLFGGTKSYKKINENEYKNYSSYQEKDGTYFFAFSLNGTNCTIKQDVAIHQAGWYIFNCNGFSSANYNAEESGKAETNALFFVSQLDGENGSPLKSNQHATPLNPLSKAQADDIMSTNVGAGKLFASGKCENQVMIHITEATEEKPVYLRFGIQLTQRTDTPTDEKTAFSDFRMYYAGDSKDPDLILDEDDKDLTHLTDYEPNGYTNATLHLHRDFNLGKWNTIILPVNLTGKQLKETFGDEVKLAKLWKLTDKSIMFKSTASTDENSIALEAFVPYIIKPTKDHGYTQLYTATLKNEDGKQVKYKTISNNHYDIPMVSLKPEDIRTNVKMNVTSGTDDWTTQYAGEGTTGTGEAETLKCYGTFGMTYCIDENKKVLFYAHRDDLAGAYFMKDGAMWKVPQKKQYGLKAFRCWFRLTEATDQDADNTSPSKEVKLYLDGVEDNNTTGIEDIFDDPFDKPSSYKADIPAIFNLNGQKVKEGTDTTGLPSGIYIVRGRKVMVK